MDMGSIPDSLGDIFLVGGCLGGWASGSVSDRVSGRRVGEVGWVGEWVVWVDECGGLVSECGGGVDWERGRV